MNSISSLNHHSHRRLNVLTNEWVLVSPHRTKRPWQGKVERIDQLKRSSYDEECYLCAGNMRANGELNPHYDATYVFPNDYAALESRIPKIEINEGLLRAKSEEGICKVVCFSPDHSKSLPQLGLQGIIKVVETWVEEFITLSNVDGINHVQIFENKGDVMGCSNPHPHGQIWAQHSVPSEAVKKSISQRSHYEIKNSSLLSDYLDQELNSTERILYENDDMVVLIPFWAVWPYESMIIPKRKMSWISEMEYREKSSFADAIEWITIRYDNLFQTSFPYSSGIHQAPTDGSLYPEWHWHMSFYPPLLRSASVKKFMVGYEMFANPQRDITPEDACVILKKQKGIHYLNEF
ncbi:UDP-glucose--hexose-1-phosphate uridylyltransferase [Ekhidna sp.]